MHICFLVSFNFTGNKDPSIFEQGTTFLAIPYIDAGGQGNLE